MSVWGEGIWGASAGNKDTRTWLSQPERPINPNL